MVIKKILLTKSGLLLTSILLGALVTLLSSTSLVTANEINFSDASVVTLNASNNFTRSVFFNFTFTNGTANSNITDPVNATVFYNASGTWTIINKSIILGNDTDNGCQGNGTCWFNITINSTYDGYWSLNISLTNLSGSVLNGSTGMPSDIRFDTSPPVVFVANISNPTAGTNHSNKGGLLLLNVSLVDAGMGTEFVFFNITNSSSAQNATYVGTQIGTTGTFNISINTSHFPDGIYNVSIYANDSQLGNFNNSAAVKVTFDNTNPTGSLSCTPSSVNTGDTVTCSCSSSDATSGVKTTSFTSNPSTSATGTFSTSCTVTDHASNSVSVSASYVVEQTSGSVSSGTGGSSSSTTSTSTTGVTEDITWAETTTVSRALFESGHSTTLNEKERLQVRVEEKEHFIGIVSVTEDTARIQISSDPIEVIMTSGETQKFEVTDDNFYDIQVTLNQIIDGKADITILSIQEEIPAPEPSPTEELPTDEEPSSTSTGLIIGIIVILVVIIAGAAWFFMKKKK